jgi:hypothetical protein
MAVSVKRTSRFASIRSGVNIVLRHLSRHAGAMAGWAIFRAAKKFRDGYLMSLSAQRWDHSV